MTKEAAAKDAKKKLDEKKDGATDGVAAAAASGETPETVVVVDEKKTLPDVITEARQLRVKLTEKELAAAGLDLARVEQDINDEENSQAEAKAAMKKTLEAFTAKKGRLVTIITRGEDVRDVVVEVRRDFKAGRVTEVRMDTGEEIGARDMRDDERQLPLSPEVAAVAEAAQVVNSTPPEAEQK